MSTDKSKEKLKVCILSGYPPAIGRGAEQVSTLTDQLKKFPELEIFILANKAPGAPDFEIVDGISIFRTWQPDSWSSIARTIKKLRQIKPHILHIYNPHLYYGNAGYAATFILSILISAKLTGIKSLVWWEHVYPMDTISKSTLDTYHYKAPVFILRFGVTVYTRLVSLLVKKVLVQTDADLHNIKEIYGVKNAQSLIIGMSGKRESKEEARKRLGVKEGQSVLLAFGFISPYKGLGYAIEAMKKVSRIYPEAILLIVGCTHPRLPNSEAYIESLKQQAIGSGVMNNISFHTSFVTKSEHSQYFSASDIVILPYTTSLGPSSVGMEAFQYQVPVIATDVNFIREDIINRKTGILVQPSDSEGLANAIINLLADRKLYEEIVNNIVTVADQYSMEQVSKQLVELYKSL